ncbi:MAG: Coenzyme F420 hydrogenase/dehydrogenase, beta subunit C-terminal domain [Muribaculaceae bacterium]
MLELVDGHIKYDYGKCQQCGACLSVCPVAALSARRLGNGLSEIVVDDEACIRCGKCVRVCPANEESGFKGYFDGVHGRGYAFGYNADDRVRAASSSGGACKTLIIELLRQGLVDGVYTLRREEEYPGAHGEFYTRDNIPGYDDIPNSVYHSVMQCHELTRVRRVDRLMIVGTSCQLRALEPALKGKYKTLIKVCIFCKQQKTLDSTRFLAKAMGTRVPENLKFSTRYRGEGWPGIVRVREAALPYSRAAQLPFGRRLWTVPGCNVCGDPFGWEAGADISLMDPWIVRQSNALGETLMVVNTPEGRSLIDSVPSLVVEEKRYDEIRPALGIKDIKRKQALVPYFRGEKCSARVKAAGRAERLQRWYLRGIATLLPRMPIIFYRCLCKLPDLRNVILRKV